MEKTSASQEGHICFLSGKQKGSRLLPVVIHLRVPRLGVRVLVIDIEAGPRIDRCQEGACARGRTWVRECVYAFVSVKERVCVCVRAEGVSPAPGALGGELRAKPEPAALPGAGPLHG